MAQGHSRLKRAAFEPEGRCATCSALPRVGRIRDDEPWRPGPVERRGHVHQAGSLLTTRRRAGDQVDGLPVRGSKDWRQVPRPATMPSHRPVLGAEEPDGGGPFG